MAVKVIMPQAGQDLETGMVKQWHKAVGDAVDEGRADRPDRDREGQSRRRGTRVGRAPRILVPEDTETAIFSTIGIIGEPGEDISGIE